MSKPSLALIPTAYKAGKLYSVLPEDGSGDFDVLRNGKGSYIGQDSFIKTALANEPRFEYNFDGTFKGVLVEPAATNLVKRSLYFESDWAIQENRIIRTFNDGIAPDGTLTATRFTRSIEGSYLLRQTFSVQPVAGQTYTYSVWIKAVERSINVDLDISDLGLTLFTVTPAEGWKRISATFTFDINTVHAPTQFFDISVTNLVLNESHYLWGAQVEVGTVATSYIPTLASQVTRPADIITRNNAQDLIGQTEGSIYCEFSKHSIEFGFETLINISLNSSQRITIGTANNASSAGELRYAIIINNIIITISKFGLNDLKNVLIATYSLNTNIMKFFVNGEKIDEIPIQSVPLMNLIEYGSRGNSRLWGSTISSLALYKTELTDQQAITLTTL